MQLNFRGQSYQTTNLPTEMPAETIARYRGIPYLVNGSTAQPTLTVTRKYRGATYSH